MYDCCERHRAGITLLMACGSLPRFSVAADTAPTEVDRLRADNVRLTNQRDEARAFLKRLGVHFVEGETGAEFHAPHGWPGLDYDAGHRHERAAVVAWLRQYYESTPLEHAAAFERSDHVAPEVNDARRDEVGARAVSPGGVDAPQLPAGTDAAAPPPGPTDEQVVQATPETRAWLAMLTRGLPRPTGAAACNPDEQYACRNPQPDGGPCPTCIARDTGITAEPTP